MATGYILDISHHHGNRSFIYPIFVVIIMSGYISGIFHFWSIACMISSLTIYNLTNVFVTYQVYIFLIVGFDLSDMVYTQVVYIT